MHASPTATQNRNADKEPETSWFLLSPFIHTPTLAYWSQAPEIAIDIDLLK